MWSSKNIIIASCLALVLLHLLTLLSDSAIINLTPIETTLLNIDCGGSETFVSPDTNLKWVGDDGYVKSGVSHTARTTANTSVVPREETTLRAFPDKKMRKNCYTVPVINNTTIKVRVGFYYGNYDGKGNPPSFDLLLDGNDWVEIDTDMDTTKIRTVIYMVDRNITKVCVGRLYHDMDPFVSFIQVIYEPHMYAKLNSTIALDGYAYAFGADALLRYPDDTFDRKWYPIDEYIVISRYANLTNGAKTINTSTCMDNPPAKLFEKAIAPLMGSKNLTITTSFLDSYPRSIYMNMYFTETNPNLTTKRSFHIYKDDQLISNASNPISPRFGEATEFTYLTPDDDDDVFKFTNITRLTLTSADDATAPPIISGMEIFYAYTFLAERKINSNDELGLSLLQKSFEVLQEWTDDPCEPVEYCWDWIKCSSGPPPRVVRLFLGGFGLSGNLPDFSDMDALLTIDLSNNSFNGTIPDFLGRFPELKELNLADNDFSVIPPSLHVQNLTVTLNLTGNSKLCQKDTTCIYRPEESGPETPPASPNRCKELMSPSINCLLVIFFIMLVF